MQKTWNLTAVFGGITALVKDENSSSVAALMANATFPHVDPFGQSIAEHTAVVRIADEFIKDASSFNGLEPRRRFRTTIEERGTSIFLIRFEDLLLPNRANQDLHSKIDGELVTMTQALGVPCRIDPRLVARPYVASDRIIGRALLESGTLEPDEGDTPYHCVKLPYLPPQSWASAIRWISPDIEDSSCRIHFKSFHGIGEDLYLDVKPNEKDVPPRIEIVNSMWTEILGSGMPYHPGHFLSYYNLCEDIPRLRQWRTLPVPISSDLCVKGKTTGPSHWCMSLTRFDDAAL